MGLLRSAKLLPLPAILLAAIVAAEPGRSAQTLGLPQVEIERGSASEVELGRKLFMDRRLSPNDTMSCAMCHIPEQGFAANELATAVGINGRSVKRNAPTVLNVAYQKFLFWDGREQSLEKLVWQPLLHPKEMGNASVDAVLAKIRALPDYTGAFERAFAGTGPTRDTVASALAAYQRTLVAAGSRFDRWFYGKEENALSTLEQQGFTVFNWFGCAMCHSYDANAALFTDHRFHNTGVGYVQAQQSKTYTVPLAPGVTTEIKESELASVSEPVEADDGRMEATRDPRHRYQYKTPSLRNVALTAPYMHDGSLKTLEEVVDFYAQGGFDNPGRDPLMSKQKLTAQDKKALLAFLKSLTSENAAHLARQARAGGAP